MGNRLFYFALCLSFIIHVFIAAFLSFATSTAKIFRKPLKQIEVTYHTLKQKKLTEHNREFKGLKMDNSKRNSQKDISS